MAVPAAVLVLAGCTEPQQANDTLPTATSTSASPTLEPLGPADFPVPDEARENTDAGAVTLAQYYFELEGTVFASLDTTWLRMLSRSCTSCDEAADQYDADRAAGNRYIGGAGTVSAVLDARQPDGQVSVGLLIEQQPFQLQAADGSVVPNGDVPARRLTGGAILAWDTVRSVWVITSYDLSQT